MGKEIVESLSVEVVSKGLNKLHNKEVTMAEVIHTRKGKYQYKYEHTREGDKVVSRYMYPVDGKGNEVKPYKDRVVYHEHDVKIINVSGKSDVNNKLVDKYLRQLPPQDTKNVGGVFIDYHKRKNLADVTFEAIDADVFKLYGEDKTERLLKEKIKEGKPSFIHYDPTWEKNKEVQKDTLYHEVGHTVYDNLPKGKTEDRKFWINRANVSTISRDDVRESVQTGKSILQLEYFADRYMLYHLGRNMPEIEKMWFDKRYR